VKLRQAAALRRVFLEPLQRVAQVTLGVSAALLGLPTFRRFVARLESLRADAQHMSERRSEAGGLPIASVAEGLEQLLECPDGLGVGRPVCVGGLSSCDLEFLNAPLIEAKRVA
jgi:hypothetical protein